MYALSLTVYLLGKYAIAVVMTSVYVYTAELFPTKYRHSLFAFASMVGRLGSITAPLTPALVSSVSMFLFRFDSIKPATSHSWAYASCSI